MLKTKLYTTPEIAKHCDVTVRTILRWLKEDKIPAPPKDNNGWWVWDAKHRKAARKFAEGRAFSGSRLKKQTQL